MRAIKTISELRTEITSDIEAAYGDSIPAFGKNFLRAIAIALAAALRIYYLYIAGVQKNIFPDTADSEVNGGTLERAGRIKLGRNPFPAQAAKYNIIVTGTIGATIDAKTTWKSDDDSLNPGKLYILDVAHVMVTEADIILVRALQAGVDSRLLIIYDTLQSTIPIANVDRLATVSSEDTEPRAAQDIEDYRQQVLDAYRTEPQGGAPTDYRLWASDAQGVERVYPYAKSGYAGQVDLFVEATTADSTDGQGTPSAGLLSDVEDVIEFDPDTTKPLNQRGRRPMSVLQVNYLPITVRQVDIEIADFTGLTADIEVLILSAMTTMVNQVRPFVAAADIQENKNDIIDVNKIISTILSAKPGSVFGTVTLSIDSVDELTHTFEQGDIPHLNSITYV